jgi:DNA-binding MarR family transcriptional regulator
MAKIYRAPDESSRAFHGPRDSTGTLYLIKRLEQAIRQRLDESLKNLELTAQQYTALTVLRARPGLSSAELARASFVTAQSMNEMVLALERKGLMARAPSETDRRVLRLELTPSAASMLAAADAIVDALEGKLLAALEGETRDTFRRALYRGLKAISNDADPGAADAPAPVETSAAPRRIRAAKGSAPRAKPSRR